MELSTTRDTMAHRRRELPEVIAEAERQAQEAVEKNEEQALLALVQRGDARAQQEAKARVERTSDTLRRLKAELLLVNEEYPRLERAAALIAKEARQRCQRQLQRLYAEAAAELGELLPQLVAIQARLAALHQRAGELFPANNGRPRPEADDTIPGHAGLPYLVMPELVHHPHADGGGKLGRLERRLAGYLEEHEGGVAVAE
jgi:chromosome segregation ATPase